MIYSLAELTAVMESDGFEIWNDNLSTSAHAGRREFRRGRVCCTITEHIGMGNRPDGTWGPSLWRVVDAMPTKKEKEL